MAIGMVRMAHENGLHGGYYKTLYRLRQIYFLPGMACDVMEYLKAVMTARLSSQAITFLVHLWETSL